MSTTQKPRVFLSYAREDGEDYATLLRDRLERDEPEIGLWRDREEMVGGQGWWKQIEEAIQGVEYMVLVLTPCAARSEITIREWRYAQQQGVAVFPVSSPYAPIDFASLPQWMRKAHCYDLDRQWDRQAALELAIFAEDVEIPMRALEALWNVDDVGAEERAERLADSSLARLNLETATLRLHDVIREYFEGQLEDPASLHARLLAGWGELDARSDAFAWRWVGYHLLAAGAAGGLESRLLDIFWLEAKLGATHPNELIADCDRWLAQAAEADGRRAVGWVRDAIRLSSHLTAADPEQLAGQMVGRLNSLVDRDTRIARLIDQAWATRERPCLIPRNSILSPAGGPLIRTLEGHSEPVTAVCVTADGQRAISASEDHTLKVWDLETGQEIRMLAGHSDEVTAVCVTADGQRAISASRDQTLKVWDLETGAEIRTLKGHSDVVTTVCVTADSQRAISASHDQTLKVWDLETSLNLSTFSAEEWLSACAISPTGTTVVAGEISGKLHFLTLTD